MCVCVCVCVLVVVVAVVAVVVMYLLKLGLEEGVSNFQNKTGNRSSGHPKKLLLPKRQSKSIPCRKDYSRHSNENLLAIVSYVDFGNT